MFKLFTISGHSLYPFYKDKERVLCHKVYKHTKININDTVVFHKDEYGLMIKKVKQSLNNLYFVQGTDPFSIDSRTFGSLKHEEIKYKVLFKL